MLTRRFKLFLFVAIGIIITFNKPANASWGNALSFDGHDDYIDTPIFLTTLDNISLECWLNWDGSAGIKRIVYNGNSANSGYGIYLENGQVCLLTGGIELYHSSYYLTSNQWTHIAIVRNAGTWEIYINGSSLSISSNPSVHTIIPSAFGTSFGIGGNPSIPSECFGGIIDDVRFWNIALSSSDIANNYNSPISSSSSGLIAYYNFDQGIANENNTGINTLIDQTSNSNNSLLNNFTLDGTNSNWVFGNNPFTSVPISYWTIIAFFIILMGSIFFKTKEKHHFKSMKN